MSIDDMGNIQEKSEGDEFISIKDELKFEKKFKVIDRIDLNQPHKPVIEVQPQPMKKEYVKTEEKKPSIRQQLAENKSKSEKTQSVPLRQKNDLSL